MNDVEWSVPPSVPSGKLAYGGVIVSDDNQQVLLRGPKDHYGDYVWTYAKGRKDKGETEIEAALREVKEELGVVAKPFALIPQWFGGTTSGTCFWLMRVEEDLGEWTWETVSRRWASFEEAEELIGKTTTPTGRQRDLDVLRATKEMLRGE